MMIIFINQLKVAVRLKLNKISTKNTNETENENFLYSKFLVIKVRI